VIQAITPIYLDTSCAARLMLSEAQEAGCNRQMVEIAKLEPCHYVSSELTKLEFISAMRARHRSGKLSVEGFDDVVREWNDLSQRLIVFRPITDAIMRSARELLTTSKVSGRLRSLDCIHFATFLEFRAIFPKTILFSADTTMCGLAGENGVSFFNPIQAP
jgi:predicted nucleic acid-binding protein